MKTMRQVVSELQAKGHHVTYYVRRDGGILIRSIDGVHYRGASGNAAAREKVNVTLSEAKLKQLRLATKTKKQLRTADEDLKAEWRRVREVWRKAFPRKKGQPHPAGHLTWGRIKYSLDKYGREEAFKRLAEAEKYAQGIAYYENVKTLGEYVAYVGRMYNSEELINLSKDILSHGSSIREEWIKPAYDELYELNNGADPSQVAMNVRTILRL